MCAKSVKEEEYEREVCGTKEENERRRQSSDAAFKPPRVGLLRGADIREEVLRSKQQEPEPKHIKVEEQHTDITDFPLMGVIVKSEDDEDQGQRSQLHPSQSRERWPEPPGNSPSPNVTEVNGDHSGGSQSDSLLAPLSDSDDIISHSPDTDEDEHFKGDMECHTENKRWKCFQCGKAFGSKYKLKVHMRTHTGEKPFACSVCGKSFCIKDSLIRHARIHTGERPFVCSFCGKSFYINDSLIRHTKIHIGEKPFTCSVCGKRFLLKAHLKTHKRTHTGEKPFACLVCGKTFSRTEHLRAHTKTHTGEKPFPCSVCGKRFAEKGGLNRHNKTHTGEKPLMGSFCTYTSGSESLCHKQQERSSRVEQQAPKTPHIKKQKEPDPTHIKKEELQTNFTNFQTTSMIVKSEDDEDQPQRSLLHPGQSREFKGVEPPGSSSSQHMTTEGDGDHCRRSQADNLLAPLSDSDGITSHSPDTDDEHAKGDKTFHTEKKRWECCQCQKTFAAKYNLNVHMRTHTGEKPFSCSLCGKRFYHKGHFSRHSRMHTGEKPFACSVCGKRFSVMGNLKTHTRMHTGEKPFVCLVCGKSFYIKDSLRRHARIHTGEKPFACSVCGKRFLLKAHLNTHTRIHTGEKAFACAICGKTFSRTGQLRTHTKTHNGEKPITSFCNFSSGLEELCLEQGQEPPYIKEEEEPEPLPIKEAEKAQDITKLPLTAITEKSEDDDENSKDDITCHADNKNGKSQWDHIFAAKTDQRKHVIVHTYSRRLQEKICSEGTFEHSPTQKHTLAINLLPAQSTTKVSGGYSRKEVQQM
ncbi:zinc finger protein 431-like [Phycodurus eques]|uniref:zinc finger protein 431-like n=1 Tax=Phycodurus eques TaxID=693459 RepID=UPI002ACEF3AF|nr:zinc finger protein 431-like [Phycodurus eques]